MQSQDLQGNEVIEDLEANEVTDDLRLNGVTDDVQGNEVYISLYLTVLLSDHHFPSN